MPEHFRSVLENLCLFDRLRALASRRHLARSLQGEILLSTNLDRSGETVSGGLYLRSDEGLIIRLR